jgi:RNA polymerase sigma-32 factor
MLSREQEHLLAVRAQHGDQRAFDRLVQAHIPLVFAIAFELRNLGVSADELLCEGLLGLVKAARDFDPQRGTRFATYAALWIRARMRSHWLDNRRVVRGPSTRNARKLRGSLRRVEREIEQRTGELAPPEAIASALQVPPHDVEEMRSVLTARDVAYGTPVAEGGVETACNGPTPEALAIEADDQRQAAARLRWALSRLEPRARRVLRSRHLNEREHSLADLGRELGHSRERVRQIEVKAKADVRAALASRHGLRSAAAPVLLCAG